MNKFALISDTHFGVRGNQQIFLDNQIDFFQNFFIPELERRNIKTVMHLGDVFDVRKNINISVLSQVKTEIFDKLRDAGIKIIMAVGNHDVFYKNTNKYNTPEELLSDYDNIKIISRSPQIVKNIGIMPWICAENYDESMEFLETANVDIILGHFEIAGFEMHSGIPCHHGLKSEIFKRFDKVISGHFHTKSTQGNISYLGTQYEMTWADHDDPKGFHVMENSELEFIRYDNIMFHKIIYNKIPPKVANYKDKYVKIIVNEVEDRQELNKFIDAVSFTEPMDLKVIENEREYIVEEIVNVDVEDTLMLMDKYVDSLNLTGNDPLEIKTILKTLHNEALGA